MDNDWGYPHLWKSPYGGFHQYGKIDVVNSEYIVDDGEELVDNGQELVIFFRGSIVMGVLPKVDGL